MDLCHLFADPITRGFLRPIEIPFAAQRHGVYHPCMANSHFISTSGASRVCKDRAKRQLVALFLHLLATVARLAGLGGARAVVAESLLVKQHLLILPYQKVHLVARSGPS